MQVKVFKDYEQLSVFAADEIVNAIKEKPSLVLCMASGHTPALTADLLAKKLLEEKVDYSGITFLGLDEWAGLPPANEGSCHYFFRTKLMEPLQLKATKTIVPSSSLPAAATSCPSKWPNSSSRKK